MLYTPYDCKYWRQTTLHDDDVKVHWTTSHFMGAQKGCYHTKSFKHNVDLYYISICQWHSTFILYCSLINDLSKPTLWPITIFFWFPAKWELCSFGEDSRGIRSLIRGFLVQRNLSISTASEHQEYLKIYQKTYRYIHFLVLFNHMPLSSIFRTQFILKLTTVLNSNSYNPMLNTGQMECIYMYIYKNSISHLVNNPYSFAWVSRSANQWANI